MSKLTLISHTLCPFVQRAAISLAEKGIEYERKDIDLGNKPDWFLKISPLGKVPLLIVSEDG
ncbi:MAG: glutathione S-transferase family protein, partial [OCS116 cluster bacterium]|nr:glutathione S-transferase family protein [OCS116 cluster bacterium]